MNTFDLLLGIATFVIIGVGFFWLMRSERYFGLLWWPYVITLGVLAILGLLFIGLDWGVVLLGIFGASLVWGATEFKEQAVGLYPLREKKIQSHSVSISKKWRAPHL